jgi:periplasmic protein CpxP/Spy
MPGFGSRMVDRICCATLLLVTCMAGYGMSGAAQEDRGTAVIPGQAQGTGQMRRAIPGVKLRKLQDKLSLSAEQKKRVQGITDDELAQLKTLREDRSMTKEKKRERIGQILETAHGRIKEILTPEQRKKYEEVLARKRSVQENQEQEEK